MQAGRGRKELAWTRFLRGTCEFLNTAGQGRGSPLQARMRLNERSGGRHYEGGPEQNAAYYRFLNPILGSS
jgi:hypothetical protein